MRPPHPGSLVSSLRRRQGCRKSSLFSYLTWSATLPGSSPCSLFSLPKSASWCIEIALTGHTCAHTPHPLQKNMLIPHTRPSSSVCIEASGHCSQHFKQEMHLSGSSTGRMLLHRPVSTSSAVAPHAIVPRGTSCQHFGLLMPILPLLVREV